MPSLTCPMCQRCFVPRKAPQSLCSASCQTTMEKLALKRSRALYKALYWWRGDRKNSKADLRFICREIAAWIEEDRAAGRGGPPRHDHDRPCGHERRKRPQREAPADVLKVMSRDHTCVAGPYGVCGRCGEEVSI